MFDANTWSSILKYVAPPVLIIGFIYGLCWPNHPDSAGWGIIGIIVFFVEVAIVLHGVKFER